MKIERSMHPEWLTNTYLVAGDDGNAVLIDAGGPLAPLFTAVDTGGLTVTHILLTHHHWDHIAELGDATDRFPTAEVLADPRERALLAASVPDLAALVTGDLRPGDVITSGGMEIEAIHTPGHTSGMLSLLVDGTDVFTGDTLFKGSVGGVRAPGHTTYADLKSSVMDVLLALPAETVVRPGHSDPTTVADELEENAFVRIWRGLDPEGSEPCTAMGKPATLVLWGPDYDGGHKAWVRWEDGSDDIVGGSQVQRG